MGTVDAPEPVLSYFAALNEDRFDDLRDVLREDVVVSPPGMDDVQGVEAAIAHYRRLLAGFPEHVDEPTRALPSGDAVTVEIDFRGRLEDGRPVEFQAVDVFDLVDGRIARVRIWYDTHGVRRQMAG